MKTYRYGNRTISEEQMRLLVNILPTLERMKSNYEQGKVTATGGGYCPLCNKCRSCTYCPWFILYKPHWYVCEDWSHRFVDSPFAMAIKHPDIRYKRIKMLERWIKFIKKNMEK